MVKSKNTNSTSANKANSTVTDSAVAADLEAASNLVSEDLTNEDDDNDEEELEISKKVYYLNSRPAKCPTDIEALKLLHWTQINENTLHHTSFQLDSVRNDKRLLSDIYDCRIISLLKDGARANSDDEDGKEYVQIQLDRDFVLHRISTLLSAYADTEDDIVDLVNESLTVIERMHEKKLERELDELAQKYRISKEKLISKLKSV